MTVSVIVIGLSVPSCVTVFILVERELGRISAAYVGNATNKPTIVQLAV